jgi:serine/threonine-protein kinase
VGPQSAVHDALGATIPAPPIVVDVSVTAAPTLRTTNASVLPKLSLGEAGARLAPSEGRRYENVQTLGRGGMGEVALVEDRDIGRKVAVKRLLGDASGPSEVARFVDEVRTVGKLEHPNIVPIHDVGVDENGQLFFVMKFVDGETLESVIARLRAGDRETTRAYDATRCMEIFAGLCRALQFAHERGIVHRDVKPANVMVGRFGEVVLMDWGVARPIGGAREGNAPDGTAFDARTRTTSDAGSLERASATSVGALIGTPLYMSPEQTRGQNDALDARSDLYSACALLHELLDRGHHRFENEGSLAALLLAIQSTDPAPPAKMFPHASDVPAELVHFVRRGLMRDPAARWQSAGEMLHELHLIADGRFHVQCPATFTKRVMRGAGRFVDRRPLTALSLGAASALGVLALAVHDLVAFL